MSLTLPWLRRATLAIVLGAPAVAQAYDYDTCGGYPVVWDDPFVMTRSSCSIPFGSTREDAMMAGINRWRNVGAMREMVSLGAISNPTCTLYHNNDVNDVAVVDA